MRAPCRFRFTPNRRESAVRRLRIGAIRRYGRSSRCVPSLPPPRRAARMSKGSAGHAAGPSAGEWKGRLGARDAACRRRRISGDAGQAPATPQQLRRPQWRGRRTSCAAAALWCSGVGASRPARAAPIRSGRPRQTHFRQPQPGTRKLAHLGLLRPAPGPLGRFEALKSACRPSAGTRAPPPRRALAFRPRRAPTACCGWLPARVRRHGNPYRPWREYRDLGWTKKGQ